MCNHLSQYQILTNTCFQIVSFLVESEVLISAFLFTNWPGRDLCILCLSFIFKIKIIVLSRVAKRIKLTQVTCRIVPGTYKIFNKCYLLFIATVHVSLPSTWHKEGIHYSSLNCHICLALRLSQSDWDLGWDGWKELLDLGLP